MWREDGQKKSEGLYENGVKAGSEIVWHPNGRVAQRRTYVKGKREGIWSYWDPSGRRIREEVFRDGELIDSRKFPDFWLQGKGS